MKTKVTLIEWPRFPIETVYFLWKAARDNEPILYSPEDIHKMSKENAFIRNDVRETFEKVVDSSIPIAENLFFVFLLEGVSISFREQMVRHKIGVKVGERLGVDMFPDIHDSTWWVQSMRVLDMGKFFDEDRYRLPESVEEASPEVKNKFHGAMALAQQAYNDLLEAGVPIEDAREVIPLGAGHRLSWGLNLSALMHICKKRSCWVPQIGTWGPVIEGMIEEVATKVDPYFRSVVTPPCIKKEEFTGCIYKLDNERRVQREDPLLPCPLYLSKEGNPGMSVSEAKGMFGERYSGLQEKFEKLWGRDTLTGKRK